MTSPPLYQLLFTPWACIVPVSATWPVSSGGSRGQVADVTEAVWSGVFPASPPLAVDRHTSRERWRCLAKNDVIRRKALLLQGCDSDHIPSVFGVVKELLTDNSLCLYSKEMLRACEGSICCHFKLCALYFCLHPLHPFLLLWNAHEFILRSSSWIMRAKPLWMW